MDQYANIQNIWLILAIWSAIYLADYYMTILTAKNFRKRLQDYISYEGSFELTPQFQKDVDRLRLFSPQFTIRWLVSVVLLYALWWASTEILTLPQYFYFLIGALVLREAAIHLRHLRNLATYSFTRTGAMTGKITYSRWYVLELSAAEFASFGFLYLMLALVVSSWFFLGGTFGCLVIAIQHWRLSKKAHTAAHVTQDTASH